ncbi:MAG: hypothetical protein EP301_03945 [Gammaproteobacteria bacterium]|jgi:general secretion pathway protein B|nr:MAG: hypothetical protein EP301_03945 [Gammaproteobacteria bacterium]
MSYILDALKKAEAERDPEARASLAMAQHERRRNRWLAYAVVIALIANAAILLWLFLPEPSTERTVTAAQPPVQQPVGQENRAVRRVEETSYRSQSPVVAPETMRQPPSRTDTVPTVTPEPAPASSPSTSSSTMTTEAATGETIIGPNAPPALTAAPLPVSSLPSGQRQRFPALEFSTHIYADDADLRAIVVNGTRLEEGDRLGSLRLEEITEDGAIFRFEDRLVSVSVLDAWN